MVLVAGSGQVSNLVTQLLDLKTSASGREWQCSCLTLTAAGQGSEVIQALPFGLLRSPLASVTSRQYLPGVSSFSGDLEPMVSVAH